MQVSILVDTEKVSKAVSIDTKNDIRVMNDKSLVIETVRRVASRLSHEGYYSCISGVKRIRYLLDTVCRLHGWEWSYTDFKVCI